MLSCAIVDIGHSCILDLRMLLKLSSRKQQNIVKGRIEWMHVSDALKRRAMSVVENYIMCAVANHHHLEE